jgi:hypothetical protein
MAAVFATKGSGKGDLGGDHAKKEVSAAMAVDDDTTSTAAPQGEFTSMVQCCRSSATAKWKRMEKSWSE